MSTVYCLEILRASPDYKRPSASSSVFFFPNPYDANEKRRKEKRDYYQGFMSYLKESGEKVPKDVDNLDEDEAQDYIYHDSYMDMIPFESTLYEVTIEGDRVTSKRIPFPQCEKLEGYVSSSEEECQEEYEGDGEYKEYEGEYEENKEYDPPLKCNF